MLSSPGISNIPDAHITARPFLPDEWATWREIRLEALRKESDKFGSRLEAEMAYSEETWRSWVSSPDRAIFGLFDSDQNIGMAGIMPWTPEVLDIKAAAGWKQEEKNQTALSTGNYIHVDYRGRGLAYLLYKEQREWLRRTPQYVQLLTAYRSSNKIMKNFALSRNFTVIEERPFLWADGAKENLVVALYDLANDHS